VKHHKPDKPVERLPWFPSFSVVSLENAWESLMKTSFLGMFSTLYAFVVVTVRMRVIHGLWALQGGSVNDLRRHCSLERCFLITETKVVDRLRQRKGSSGNALSGLETLRFSLFETKKICIGILADLTKSRAVITESSRMVRLGRMWKHTTMPFLRQSPSAAEST
jgi:hypothetical protein